MGTMVLAFYFLLIYSRSKRKKIEIFLKKSKKITERKNKLSMDLTTSFHLLEWSEQNKNKKKNKRKSAFRIATAMHWFSHSYQRRWQIKNERETTKMNEKCKKKPLKILSSHIFLDSASNTHIHSPFSIVLEICRKIRFLVWVRVRVIAKKIKQIFIIIFFRFHLNNLSHGWFFVIYKCDGIWNSKEITYEMEWC